jgi:hypothetical protein
VRGDESLRGDRREHRDLASQTGAGEDLGQLQRRALPGTPQVYPNLGIDSYRRSNRIIFGYKVVEGPKVYEGTLRGRKVTLYND